MKRLLTSLLALSLLTACGKKDAPTSSTSTTPAPPSAKSGATLKFSAIPDQDSATLKQNYDALAKHLAAQLGIPVEYVAATDYAAAVDLFKKGDVQLAWLGGLTAAQAIKAVPGAHAIAQGDSDHEFMTYFIANKDAGLNPGNFFPASIAEKSFAFGPELSTSGHLMPAWYIIKDSKKKPDAFFRVKPIFTTGHDKTCELVQSGEVQAGAVSYEVYEHRVKAGTTDPSIVQVIWKSPSYPNASFVAHPDLEKAQGTGFTDKLQAALIAIKDPALLATFPRKALIPAKNEDFEEVKQTATELGYLP
jgi:phosphonate transport system substrate-binding protein